MNKLAAKLCIGGVLLTIILCGCTPTPDPVCDSSQAVQDWNGVHLELRQDVYPRDVLKLEFTFKNETKYYLNYGSKWQLERYDTKGNLSLCPYDSDYLFHQSLCILPPNISETISINFFNYRRYLRPGRYRIAFGPINVTEEDLGELIQRILNQFILYTDFSIETASTPTNEDKPEAVQSVGARRTKVMSIYLYFLGALLIVGVIIRIFRPSFLLSKELHAVLESRGTTKKYLLSRQINSLVFGGIPILAGYLPESQKIPACMPLLVLVLVSGLACNKIFVGSIWGKG